MPRGVRRRGEDEERRVRYLPVVPYRRGDRQGESGGRPRERPLPEESGSAETGTRSSASSDAGRRANGGTRAGAEGRGEVRRPRGCPFRFRQVDSYERGGGNT